MRRKKAAVICMGSLLLFFSISGYLLSDDYFFRQLIRKENIHTPTDAYHFVIQNTMIPTEMDVPRPGHTPRYLLTKQKAVYCDEGAIILATIVNKLGYPTRLVDLVDEKGVSHHTVLEVLQEGRWKVYDTLFKRQGLTYQQSVPYPCRPRFRTYPRIYNQIIQLNYFVKKLALWIRQIDE